jgi:hypothetical protein
MTSLLYSITAGCLLGLLDFAVLSANLAPLALVASILTGFGAVALGRYFSAVTAERLSGTEIPLAAGATLFAASLQALLSTTTWAAWLGIPVAAVSAWAIRTRFTPGSLHTCFVCQTVIKGEFVMQCPRCHQVVCGQPDCWNARFLRCRLCHDREVVVLPPHDRWWRQQLGERVTQGSCFSCYKGADEADLRACGKCHWPVCRRCWDYHNGQCPRCHWVMPGLPAELAAWLPAARRAREALGAAPLPPADGARGRADRGQRAGS